MLFAGTCGSHHGLLVRYLTNSVDRSSHLVKIRNWCRNRWSQRASAARRHIGLSATQCQSIAGRCCPDEWLEATVDVARTCARVPRQPADHVRPARRAAQESIGKLDLQFAHFDLCSILICICMIRLTMQTNSLGISLINV